MKFYFVWISDNSQLKLKLTETSGIESWNAPHKIYCLVVHVQNRNGGWKFENPSLLTSIGCFCYRWVGVISSLYFWYGCETWTFKLSSKYLKYNPTLHIPYIGWHILFTWLFIHWEIAFWQLCTWKVLILMKRWSGYPWVSMFRLDIFKVMLTEQAHALVCQELD